MRSEGQVSRRAARRGPGKTCLMTSCFDRFSMSGSGAALFSEQPPAKNPLPRGGSFASLRMTGGTLRMTGGTLRMTGGTLRMTGALIFILSSAYAVSSLVVRLTPSRMQRVAAVDHDHLAAD